MPLVLVMQRGWHLVMELAIPGHAKGLATCRQALAAYAKSMHAEVEQLFPALLQAGSLASSCACREAPGSLHWAVACENAAPTTYSRYGSRCAAACPSQRPEG